MADNKLYVQAGKSVTSRRGILNEGSEVSAKDFKGKDSISQLTKAELIGTKKPDLRTKAEIVAEREEKKLADRKKAAEKKETPSGGAEKK